MSNRFARAAVIAALAVGSLALWIAIPAGWLWVTRGIDHGARFVIVILGCVASMSGAAVLLYRLEGVLLDLDEAEAREPGPPSWLRPSTGVRRAQPLGLLDVFLVASAILAALALVVWWAFFADSSNPSGPLQPL